MARLNLLIPMETSLKEVEIATRREPGDASREARREGLPDVTGMSFTVKFGSLRSVVLDGRGAGRHCRKTPRDGEDSALDRHPLLWRLGDAFVNSVETVVYS